MLEIIVWINVNIPALKENDQIHVYKFMTFLVGPKIQILNIINIQRYVIIYRVRDNFIRQENIIYKKWRIKQLVLHLHLNL